MLPSLSSRDPAMTLKSMPPRVTRGFLERDHLRLDRLERSGSQAFALLAPTGYGKTAQLVQWRREALARGALVFWFSADTRDDSHRLIQGLLHCAKVACGKRGFNDEFMAWASQCTDLQEVITGWFAEVVALSVNVVLLIDDAELIPTVARKQVLTFLLENPPSNLTIALAAKSSSALLASGILSLRTVMPVMAAELRFRLEETMQVLSSALGERCHPDAAVRLHELTEGWPLGIQLAIVTLTRGGDLDALVAAASSDIQRYFVEAVINVQWADATQLLIRAARFTHIHPDLCAEVLGDPRFAIELMRLQTETPLLLRTEGENWMRLHPLAREVLEKRLRLLPQEELNSLSRKASSWYTKQQLFEEAAEQSFLAGDVAKAIELVALSTMNMTVQGRSNAVLTWYERLSAKELRERPAFWIPAAWALSMSDRYAEAQPLLELILAQPDLKQDARFEAALIGITAAAFADRFDIAEQLFKPWPQPPREAAPGTVPIYVDALAFSEILRGDPSQARLTYSQIGRLDRSLAYSPVSYGFAALGIGISYLWEGRGTLADDALRPALVRTEERQGRYHPMACMLAASLAQACWETSRQEEAVALLAGRLETVEHFGMPDALMAAYRTLARIAEAEGRQNHSLTLLERLKAIGISRAMIRVQVLAQTEMIRLHVKFKRTDMASAMSTELNELIASHRVPIPTIFAPWVELHAALARVHVLLAIDEGVGATSALKAMDAATKLAASLKRTGAQLEIQFLRVQALRRSGSADALAIQNETVSLAQAEGMTRLLLEFGAPTTHPSSAEGVDTRPSQVRGAGLLTTKEQEVLTLLIRNLSNKEIALAMGVGDQTIKWHIKNLCNKLNAASRKHAVARARLMGLIDG